MNPGMPWKTLVAPALLAAALASSGCVLVVGGDRKDGKAEVEWASNRDYASPAPRAAGRDARLAREVSARLLIDSALVGEDITVASTGDVVTLHGRVQDIAVLEHAMRVAADVPGVARVVSRVTVEMEGR